VYTGGPEGARGPLDHRGVDDHRRRCDLFDHRSRPDARIAAVRSSTAAKLLARPGQPGGARHVRFDLLYCLLVLRTVRGSDNAESFRIWR
jgi:hypothetical protein